MILSDVDIKARLEKGDLVIDPIADPDRQIQPASVDLRLGNQFLGFYPFRKIDPFDQESVEHYTFPFAHLGPSDFFSLQPNAFVLGTTVERVKVPNDLVGRVEGRSSVGRLGVIIHASAGFIDPGFEGRITLELSNLGPSTVKLYAGMRICQIAFHVLLSECDRPYGASSRGSKYFGQKTTTASRIVKDFQNR